MARRVLLLLMVDVSSGNRNGCDVCKQTNGSEIITVNFSSVGRLLSFLFFDSIPFYRFLHRSKTAKHDFIQPDGPRSHDRAGTGYLQVPPPYLRLFCELAPSLGFIQSACDDASIVNSTMPHAAWASCKARMYQMDIVINYCENTTIPNLVLNGTKGFNLDAAFTKDGVLRALYRKSHIWGTGPYLSQPSKPDPVVFNSSFGVTFGMFTCYDFWFLNPMMEEINQLGITDFLFPSEMQGGPPLLTGELQAAWSRLHQVNLVASCALGGGAAGLYHKGTPLAFIGPLFNKMFDVHNIVVADIPRIPTPKRNWGHQIEIRSSPKSLRAFLPSDGSVEVLQGDKCAMGPPNSSIPFACVPFTPKPKGKFDLSVNFTSPSGTVRCRARVTTASASQHKWILGAMVASSPPTQQTPTGEILACCALYQCDSLETYCSTSWQTDLLLEDILIQVQFSGNLTASQSVFPFIGLDSGVMDSDPDDAMLRVPPADEIQLHVSTKQSFYSIGWNASQSRVLGSTPFMNAGVSGETRFGPD